MAHLQAANDLSSERIIMESQGDEEMRHVVPKREDVKESTPSPKPSALREIRKLFDQYANEVDSSDLSQSSKTMYIDFANCFVRWMNGGFQPGMQKRGKQHSNIVR